ncbi:glyoxalase/bleomycin resistance protein/dioxygenase family protein [Rhizobium sp. TAL182]|nr:glyoxalase/bleomycin resistance protein/dioxygenase family protein [Rhizobium sp. TAL182]
MNLTWSCLSKRLRHRLISTGESWVLKSRARRREYTMLRNGDAVIAINSQSVLSSDHPLRGEIGNRVGLGVEIVLKVADVEDAYRKAEESGWPLSALATQPWGLRDFRLVDPDGYYVRVTSTHTN